MKQEESTLSQKRKTRSVNADMSAQQGMDEVEGGGGWRVQYRLAKAVRRGESTLSTQNRGRD